MGNVKECLLFVDVPMSFDQYFDRDGCDDCRPVRNNQNCGEIGNKRNGAPRSARQQVAQEFSNESQPSE